MFAIFLFIGLILGLLGLLGAMLFSCFGDKTKTQVIEKEYIHYEEDTENVINNYQEVDERYVNQ